MARDGKSNTERFPYIKGCCRVCTGPLPKRKRTFCSYKCVRDFMMQTDWDRVRRVVFERDGGVCMICGKDVDKKNYHVDHIVPISKGGDEWGLDNLQLTCPRCNLRKGDKLVAPRKKPKQDKPEDQRKPLRWEE